MSLDTTCIVMTVFERQSQLDAQLAFLDRTLDPALGVAILVYDDGSAVPLTIPASRDDVRLLRGATNLGLIAARNAAFRAVMEDFDYLVVLDDDIRLYNIDAAIRLGIAALKAGNGIVSFPYIDLPLRPGASVAQFRRLLPATRRSSTCFFAGCSILPTSVLRRVGFLEGIYRFALEEEDYSLRLYAAGLPTAMLYGESVIAIHDHAPGKNPVERAALLLSNRFLYHYKFVRPVGLRVALNGAYAGLYLLKWRSVAVVRDANRRYAALKPAIERQPMPTRTLLGFLLRRYVI